jgi:microcystin-dependent protein
VCRVKIPDLLGNQEVEVHWVGLVQQGGVFITPNIGDMRMVAVSNDGTQIVWVTTADESPLWSAIADVVTDVGGLLSDVTALENLVNAIVDKVVPAGTISATIGATADVGYLLLDGATVINGQTLYPALWARLPTAWKSGSNIVLKDARGRSLAMANGTTITLGDLVGANTVTIASANLPTHTHTMDHDHGSVTSANETQEHTHTFSGTTSGRSASHTHTVGSASWSFLLWGGSGPYGLAGGGTNATTTSATDAETGEHTHTYSGTTAGRSASHNHTVDLPNFTGSTGNGGFANTALTLPVAPSLGTNFQIKAH